MGVFDLLGVCEVVEVTQEEVRDSDGNLSVVEPLAMALELREQGAELHSQQAFKVYDVVFGRGRLEVWHERKDLKVENRCLQKQCSLI